MMTKMKVQDKSTESPKAIAVIEAAIFQVGLTDGWEKILDMIKACAGGNGASNTAGGSTQLAHRLMQEISTVCNNYRFIGGARLQLHCDTTVGNPARGSPGGKPGHSINTVLYPKDEEEDADALQKRSVPELRVKAARAGISNEEIANAEAGDDEGIRDLRNTFQAKRGQAAAQEKL